MRRPAVWIVLAITVFLAGGQVGQAGRTALAEPARQGEETCPEPNNSFQTACFITPNAQILGVLHAPDDVDAYRYEALDYGTHVQFALLDPPGPYRLNLADWTGSVI